MATRRRQTTKDPRQGDKDKRKAPKPSTGSRTGPSVRIAAKGQRTLIHVSLPQQVVDDVDTLLWLRATAARESVEAIRGGKHQIYDEAVNAFLRLYERRRCEKLRGPRVTSGWRTLWVSTPLVARCRMVSDRDAVSVGRIVGYALASFLSRHITAAARRFRRDVAERAASLLVQP